MTMKWGSNVSSVRRASCAETGGIVVEQFNFSKFFDVALNYIFFDVELNYIF